MRGSGFEPEGSPFPCVGAARDSCFYRYLLLLVLISSLLASLRTYVNSFFVLCAPTSADGTLLLLSRVMVAGPCSKSLKANHAGVTLPPLLARERASSYDTDCPGVSHSIRSGTVR